MAGQRVQNAASPGPVEQIEIIHHQQRAGRRFLIRRNLGSTSELRSSKDTASKEMEVAPRHIRAHHPGWQMLSQCVAEARQVRGPATWTQRSHKGPIWSNQSAGRFLEKHQLQQVRKASAQLVEERVARNEGYQRYHHQLRQRHEIRSRSL